MSKRPSADVIVTPDRDLAAIDRCVRSVLKERGSCLRRVIVIDDRWPGEEGDENLQALVDLDNRVHLVRNPARLGPVGSFTRGMTERHGDAVILSSDCVVGDDWLFELAAVAHSEERTACASPLLNVGGTCSVPRLNQSAPSEPLSEKVFREACAGLPRWTVAPIVEWSCIYLRADVIDAVGILDSRFKSIRAAVNNWVSRAQALGFVAKRANHTYVHRSSSTLAATTDEPLAQAVPAAVDHDDLHLERQLARFGKTLDGHLAAHAVHAVSTGRIPVAFDIRHLPRELVGTRTYAVSLGRCLGEIADIDLTLLVQEPGQAKGLKGRVVPEADWNDDVAIIHKPSQVTNVRELPLLFEIVSHLVLTYQDLIGYRIPMVFPTDEVYEQYRATSCLTVQAAQHVLAYSKNAAEEIKAEFGIPRQDVTVVPLGVDAEWFALRAAGDLAIRRALKLPRRFFLSLATDFPHKNLPNLLDAYAMLRNRWQDGQPPPGLVLAGYTSSARTGFYPGLESKPLGKGLTMLGPVSRHELRVLYQNALALVFPSLYEGFGLPPLEAMAAGTPVVAMAISSVPEVVGDACLAPDGLSPLALAQAMEAIATDDALRDELINRGTKRVDQFLWDQTARATVDVYRSTVLFPSERSLHARYLLRDAIIRWSEPHVPSAWVALFNEIEPFLSSQPVGIRTALKALNVSVHARLRRELRRLKSRSRRKSA